MGSQFMNFHLSHLYLYLYKIIITVAFTLYGPTIFSSTFQISYQPLTILKGSATSVVSDYYILHSFSNSSSMPVSAVLNCVGTYSLYIS